MKYKVPPEVVRKMNEVFEGKVDVKAKHICQLIDLNTEDPISAAFPKVFATYANGLILIAYFGEDESVVIHKINATDREDCHKYPFCNDELSDAVYYAMNHIYTSGNINMGTFVEIKPISQALPRVFAAYIDGVTVITRFHSKWKPLLSNLVTFNEKVPVNNWI